MSIADKPVETTLAIRNLISVEDYLAAELDSDVRHEYVGGVVYEMTGAKNIHATISLNIAAYLHIRLRGKRCRPFNNDTKIRVRLPTDLRFYYPDVSVTCNPGPPHDTYQGEPTVVIEVLSRSTRRIDLGEKKDAYLTIPSLNVYLLVEQERAEVVAFRRTEQGFVREFYQGLDAVVPLAEIESELPLKEIYEAVEFVPEPDRAD